MFLIFTILIVASVLTGFIINDFRFEENFITFSEGVLYFIYEIQLLSLSLLAFYAFIKKYLKSKGIYKAQLGYILLGLFITVSIALIVNLIVPQKREFINFIRLGVYGTVFFISSAFYAIFKYRLMDIRVIIRRSAVLLFLL